MKSAIPDTEYRALAELRYRIRHFIQEGDAAAQRASLEPQQYLMLLAIRGLPHGAVATIRTLAERMALKHHSAVELIDRLESHRLVRRIRSPGDKREVRVSLLPQGSKLLDRVARERLSELKASGMALADAIAALVERKRPLHKITQINQLTKTQRRPAVRKNTTTRKGSKAPLPPREKGAPKNSFAQAEYISNMANVTIPNPTDATPAPPVRTPWWHAPGRQWRAFRDQREEQVFLVLTLLIGAIVGLVVVAFILITERFGARLYPVGSSTWRKLLVPVAGSLAMGYLLYRFFPDARGSGVPQTKAALWARGGRISFATVFGKFFCTSATLRLRNSPRARRPSRASRFRHRLHARPIFRIETGKGKGAYSRRRRRCDRRRIQHAACRRSLRTRRSSRRLTRPSIRFRCIGFRHFLGNAAVAARQ